MQHGHVVCPRSEAGMESLAVSRSAFFSSEVFRVVTILAFCLLGVVRADDLDAEEELCPVGATVDLDQAFRNDSGFLDESGNFFPLEVAKFRAGGWRGCICDIKPCLPFCPPVNGTRTQVAGDFVEYSAIPKVYTANLTLDDDEESRSPEERFHLVVWEPCDERTAYFLEPEMYETDEFYLLRNGSLFLPLRVKIETRLLGLERYCLIFRSDDSGYVPRVCSPKVQQRVEDVLATAKYFGALVAVPFLIATIVVYSVLPELRNIHGTTLRCYLCCLVITYIALAADRIPPPDRSAGPLCMFLGFTIYFFFLACFFWLNVMCVDMWWRFGGFASLQSSGGRQERKKFIGYSIYAWGSVILMTSVCIGMEFGPGIPDSMIRPEFKMNACWFKTKTAAALYFFGPIGVTILCNICLFIATSIKIVQHTRDTQRQLNSGDSRRHDDNKQWFSLYLKLSVIMGITWSTEVISWLWKGPKYLWLVTDMVNALQGFLIFFIFVCKRKIWKSLKKRYNELQFTKKGCIFSNSNNSDSPPTTAVSDTVCCNVSVLVLEEMNNINKQNINQTGDAKSSNKDITCLQTTL